jgi:hypothetical protein
MFSWGIFNLKVLLSLGLFLIKFLKARFLNESGTLMIFDGPLMTKPLCKLHVRGLQRGFLRYKIFKMVNLTYILHSIFLLVWFSLIRSIFQSFHIFLHLSDIFIKNIFSCFLDQKSSVVHVIWVFSPVSWSENIAIWRGQHSISDLNYLGLFNMKNLIKI